MPNLTHEKGKYSNSSIEEEANRGNYGKFTLEQIEERYELHARRWHDGVPTLQSIVDHWKDKYGIEVTKQSEKEWALRDKNKARIQAVQEKMLEAGKLEIATISDQTLINSASTGARTLAGFMKSVKAKADAALSSFDPNMAPWDMVGVSKKDYKNASPEELKLWKPKVDLETSVKKSIISVLKDLSRIVTTNSEELRKTIELADGMSKDRRAHQSSLMRNNDKKKALDRVSENKIIGAESVSYEEVDIEAMRNKVYGEGG